MSELSVRLAGLSAEKRELLEALLRKKRAEAAPAGVIPLRGAAPGLFPLSFSQERLWLLHQLEPESPAYNIPIALRLTGNLDVRALWGSFAALVRRHESLRTRFAVRDGNPVQGVDPPGLPPLPLVDLRGLPAGLREAEARGRAETESLRPFDLQKGPLWRCVLFRLAAGDHLLLATLHHIVSDGWSTAVFARELGAFYTAARSGRPAALPSLPIQYADFALWQRKELAGPALERHLAFWRQRLAGLDRVLEVPADRPRPASRCRQGASFPLALPEPLSRGLKELATRRETTLSTTLLAALFALLHRQTDKEDLCVGTPVAGRRQVETEGLIGFFVNTLVVRVRLSEEPSFRDHLARVHEAVLDAQGHEELPFEKLVSELAPERSLSHNPIFQVAFTFQHAPGQTLELPGVAVRSVDLPLRAAKFDLTLALGEGDGRIAGGIDYSLDLFDAPTIARIAGQLQAVLTAVAADPAVPLSAIPLLGPPERHQLLVEWGGQGEEPATGETLHGRFEAQVRRRPEAPAVLWDGAEVSYGELNRRANQLASRLRQLGVGPESRVGLSMQRSLELVVGILGILKAGGSCVPLDPDYPQERLAYRVEDAGVEIVVGRDLLEGPLEALPSDDLPPLADGSSLASVIYTSGSTGRPKGVLVSHGNVVRLFDSTRAWFGFDERDVWTLFHSDAFDFSVWELWGALLYGGQVVVVPSEVSRSPDRFLDLLVRDKVTVLNQTPSAFTQLARVDEERGGVDTDLRLVIFGGEALDVAGLAPWFARHGDDKPLLVNMYGITEATVHVTCRPLRVEDIRGGRRSVIGVPIPDLSLYVLDRWQQPAPIGVPGELVVGGAGLARGYLGRPELTAARFIPDPVSGRPGARLYRSGDLGRFLPAGEVEYLGRIDHQVKMNGEVDRRALSASVPATPVLSGIARTPRDGGVPLSFAQQRLWLLEQLEPGTPAYNIPLAMRVTGALSLGRLEGIFAALVRRHEALRTTFAVCEGRPVQVVAPSLHPRLPVIDLSGLPERDVRARGLAWEEAARPFDLARGPLLRLSLIRLGEQDHLLLMTMHHIVSDGWSMGVLLREVAALYRGSPLPELPIQYADFAVWQREWLRGEVLETQLSYWRRQLAGAPKILELPLDRPRPALQTFRGTSRNVILSSELSEAVHELCRREGVTPFMVLLAAWAALLGRHAGQEDVLLGTPIAGRNRQEIEGLIGFFVNTLVLRTDLASPPDFTALLEQARRTALDAYTHQDLPFERLVEELVPERDLSRAPLFQAMLVLQNAPGAALSLPGLVLTPLGTSSGTAQFDLTLALEERRDGVFQGALEHNTDVFDGSTAARLWDRFTALLEAAAGSPGLTLSALPLLPAAERHQALVEWNDTARAHNSGLCLHQRVALQAESRPDAVAVSFEGQALSYRELDRRANRLARRLIGCGVEPEARVAVLAERSPELIVAFLGILKAGGVYVPLDPAYPRERLDFMREDSGAAVLLTLERLGEALAGESDEAPADVVDAGQLAYVLYTSGSTGRPKGVMVSHAALARYAESVPYTAGPGDRVLQFCSVSFDTSLEEVVLGLTRGAELALRTDAMLESPAVFLESCSTRGITALSLPTAYWHEVAAKVGTEGLPLPPGLRLVILGGERALLERVEAWRRYAPDRPRLVNSYGVTEATIVSTAVDLEWPSAAERRGEVSIGRGIPGAELYLLDRESRPVPPGTLGELYLGGGLLARGYLGRPDLTAERFVPDPFAAAHGARLYRTGDLARALADGALEYGGRADRQIKVRGYRIEIEELEARLLRHPDVESAVVVVREDQPGEKRIVAYVVPRGLPGPAPAALRTFLRESLPDYMVPGTYVALASLPLTPNGKVDRRALSASAALAASAAPERTSLGEGIGAPSNPAEELLAGIWSEVLGLERIGIHDDFFALGGHSLLATQVVSRVRAVFGVELPLRRLFESPTVAELARAVREGRADQAVPPIVPVSRHAGDSDLPLSFAQQRLWLLDQLAPGNPAYNMPLAVRLTGEVDPARMAGIFAEIVRRHEALRTTFASREGRPVQVIAPPRVELPLLDLSQVGAQEALRLAREEAGRPFDLERGPLLRLALIRLGEREHVLLLTMHHIVSDGWSMGVLLREIAALYEGSALPELAVQYADFAVWQRRWLEGEVVAAQLAYWRRQLEGAPQVLELPTDRPRPPVQTFRGAPRPLAFPPVLSNAIHDLCRRQGVTPFMVLLAAWSALLGRLAGQEDLLVGTPIAGRNRREIEDLIGFFVNTLVLRTSLSGAPGFGELLGRMRSTALDAYAHQDLSFERLVEELVPARDLGRSPLVQVLFALQNAPRQDLTVPGLALSPIDLESPVARFDLSLVLSQGADGFAGVLEHNLDLFDGGTAERLALRFVALLERAVADPGQSVGDLPLLLAGEQQQVLEHNDTRSEYPRESSLPELFAAVARSIPEAPAVVAHGQVWSYRRLDEASNRLAHRLRALGVGPESAVGVAMERSPELVLGVLAVLKAGGAYLPLDAEYPDERLAFMLADSRAQIVLVHERTRQRLEGLARLVSVDEEEEESGAPLAVEVPAESLALVIYTSGSTGRPKGVALAHRGIVRLVRDTNYLQLGPGDRMGHAANISFDAATLEIWGALLNGAALVVIPREVALSPAELASQLQRDGVTVLFLTTALFHQVARETPEALRGLRTVMFGGEAADPGAVARVAGPALVHLYGPAESTTLATWHRVLEVPPGAVTVPIGLPVANSSVCVLDRRQGLVPPGVVGELCVGGDGLARGYLNRPDLTAERFIPHPWSVGRGGERLYRTGDLARQRPDGAIEFVGRGDDQVKIRGFRIEPGEVEAALLAHPAVREAVVLAREEPRGGRRLVAWVTGDPEERTLRTWLRERLPDSMVPAAFVLLEALPLTPNGKVDRASLPAPERTRERQHLAPRDVLELRLVRLWEELLDLRPIGVHDDFFELGGHSLLAVQLVARLQKSFEVSLPMAALLRNPTVERLAAVLREGGETSRTALVELAPGQGRPFFCIHAIGGEVLGYIHLARHLAADRPVYGIQVPELDAGAPPATLEAMAAWYLRALRKVQPAGPYTLGGWSMGGVVAVEMARQLEQEGEAVDLVVLVDSFAPGSEDRPVAGGELVALFAYDLARLFEIDLFELPPGFGQLAAEDALRRLSFEAKRLGILPPGLEDAELERRFAVFQANFRALERYSGGSCAAPLILFKAAGSSADLGWGGPIEIHELPGDHYTLLRQPQVQSLAALLRERLQSAEADG